MARQYTTQDFIDAIPGTGGIITAIARKIGCSWNTAQKYIDTHPTVRAAYDDECESMLDLAETTILASIKGGDSGDAKWYLSRKGKGRGYVERIEQDVTSKGDKLEIGVKVIDYRNTIAALAPGPVPDSDAPGKDEDTDDGSSVG